MLNKPVRWASKKDTRTTRVGRISKIRVDEIPQFWNILKGEMSFCWPKAGAPHLWLNWLKRSRFTNNGI